MKTRVTFKIAGPVVNAEGSAVVETNPFVENHVIVGKAVRYIKNGMGMRPSVFRDHVLTPIKIEKDIR